MRTTVTLDADTGALVRELMAREGIGFKEAINRAIRGGLSTVPRHEFRQRTFAMGFRPEFSYSGALQVAGELADRQLVRELDREG
jgi:hypothetical protein